MVGPPPPSETPMFHGSHRLAAASAPTDGTSSPPRGSALVRLGWMLGGTLVMAISLMVIAGKPPMKVGLPDVVFWATVVVTGLLRTLDVTRFHGETTRGTPATTTDLKRYLGGLAAVSIVGWLVAQAVHV